MKNEFKLTEIGVIPEEWEVKPLSGVCSMKSGNSITSKNIDESGKFPCFGGNGLRGYTSSYTHDGTFPLIGRQGALCGNIQLVSSKFFASEHAVVVSPKHKTDMIWLSYVLARMNLNQYSESSAQPGLSVSKILLLPIPLPPLPEQTAIATALSDMDALLAQTEKILQKKKAIKQGLMQELLRAKEGWVVKRLGEVGTFSKGSGIRKDEALSGEIPCIRYGELYTKHNEVIKEIHSFISKKVSLEAKKLKTGDILFAGSGETKEEIGKCAAFIGSFEAYAGGDIVILSPINANTVFLGYLLNTPLVQKQKASRGQGDAIVHISASQLSSVVISLPPLPEQTRIAQILTDADAAIQALEAKITKLQAQKQGMMQALLTGKIRLTA